LCLCEKRFCSPKFFTPSHRRVAPIQHFTINPRVVYSPSQSDVKFSSSLCRSKVESSCFGLGLCFAPSEYVSPSAPFPQRLFNPICRIPTGTFYFAPIGTSHFAVTVFFLAVLYRAGVCDQPQPLGGELPIAN